jgi:hypothetical protein
MRSTLHVDGQLAPEEAAARLAKAQPADPTGAASEWTDNMTIQLRPGRTVADLVDVVLAARLREAPGDEIRRVFVDEFGLPDDDAELACDRTWGGLVRAVVVATPLRASQVMARRARYPGTTVAWKAHSVRATRSTLDNDATWPRTRLFRSREPLQRAA